uniref:Peptidase M12B propeptide domain-containing protein n=1 Tax=Knipowitschia caucasica TaxID=637954 RepID=A0AAV2MJ48_KNICA
MLHTSGLYIASSVDSLQHVLGEYGLVRPVSVDAEGRFLSHAVSAEHLTGGQPRRRWRREVQAGNDEWEGPDSEDNQESAAQQENLYYNVTVFGREFHLRLRHNARLVAPGAKMEWHDDSDSIRHTEALHDQCLYVGDVPDTPGATVAISNCDGLVKAVKVSGSCGDRPAVCGHVGVRSGAFGFGFFGICAQECAESAASLFLHTHSLTFCGQQRQQEATESSPNDGIKRVKENDRERGRTWQTAFGFNTRRLRDSRDMLL